MSTVPVRPRTRSVPDVAATEVVALASPPTVELGASGGLWQAVLPAIGGVGALVWVAANPKPLNVVAGGLFATASIAGALGMAVSLRRQRYRQRDRQRARYLDHLADVQARAVTNADAQRAALARRLPEPAALPVLAATRDVWQHARGDDRIAVRVGIGTRPPTLAVQRWDDPGPLADLDPVLVRAADALRRRTVEVPGVPVDVALADVDHLDVAGDRAVVLPLARALVAQLAVGWAPDDVRVAVLAAPANASDWAWCKWLPHARHDRLRDVGGALRMIASDESELARLLADEIALRRRTVATPAQAELHPRLVVVVDNDGAPVPQWLLDAAELGLTIVRVGSNDVTSASARRALLHIADRQNATCSGARSFAFAPDALGPTEADAVARALAPLRVDTQGVATGDAAPVATLAEGATLPDLLGVGADDLTAAITRWWREREPGDRLRVAFGVTDDGTPAVLDLKEAALGGMGPHGLMIGATGSGKSEALRSMVLALALRHPPELVNFVLVDFKGGAAFADLASLPHVAGLVTNLADDSALVERVQDALQGELRRRQTMLAEAGNLASIHDYERLRASRPELPVLPALLVVVDEFAELLIARAEIVELFNAIGRLGRSLGIHLLFSSQRLDEGRLRGLDSHLSYRIALRTFSAAESRAVIGVDDAFRLTGSPGRGYLKVDTTVFQRFRVALASVPNRRRTAAAASDGPVLVHPVVFGVRPIAGLGASSATASIDVAAATDAHATFLDAAVAAIVAQGAPRARAVWLAPLPPVFTLDAVVGAPPVRRASPLVVPYGVADYPLEQRQAVASHDFGGAGSSLLVTGGPRSGKSTLLRTMVLGAALTHSPADLQVYTVDLGAGGLDALRGLPHVGAVAGRAEPELVGRIVREVSALVTRRERLFQSSGIDGIASFRARRAAGELPGERHGDVFLLIDNWAAFRADFEELESTVVELAGRGAGYGVHLVVAAARPLDVRTNLKDLLGGRIELRLTEPGDSEIDRKAAARLRADLPGRALLPGGVIAQVALARLDGRADVATAGEGLTAAMATVAGAWPGVATAPAVHLLPHRVGTDQLAPPTGGGVVIGVSEHDLGPVELDLVGGDPHLVVYGDAASGKTTFLRTYLAGLVERSTPDQVRFLVVDYRRTLTDAVPAPYLAAYCGAPSSVDESLQRLAVTLAEREPPADVTLSQLRERSWWTGPDIVVAVDDYELVAGPQGNPLSPLANWLPHARDLGVHVVVARRTGGAGRAAYDPLLQQVRELCDQGLLLSGDPTEGDLVGGVRARPLPPGRGVLVRRRESPMMVQIAQRPATAR